MMTDNNHFKRNLTRSETSHLRWEFILLFSRKEGKTLIGKGLGNFWFLLIIFLLTFLAIGFANGSLEYLRTKMHNPFINWVSVEVPYAKSENIKELQENLIKDKESQKKFFYHSVTGYNYFSIHFWTNKLTGTKSVFGRTIEPGNPLLQEIFKNNNLIKGRTFKSSDDIGLIVTQDLLKTLNYPKDACFILMGFSDEETDKTAIPIPIIAIVRDLPGLTQFMCTPYFYGQRFIVSKEGNPFLAENIRGISFIFTDDSSDAIKTTEKFRNYIKSRPDLEKYDMTVWLDTFNVSYKPCFLIKFNIFNDTSFALRNQIYSDLIKNKIFQNDHLLRFYDYRQNFSFNALDINRYDWISIEFLSLDKLNEFKEFLSRDPYGINMEMSQIETLKNYNFITNLTRIICLILMFFSILSICLFISDLLRNHLEKIKMNIGTFLAFGIHFKSLERIYFSIIFFVLILSMVAGLLLSWGLGSLGFLRFILQFLDIKLEDKQTYFLQFSEWTLFMIGIILVVSYFVIKQITNKIFKKTPGDLLYDRA